MSNTTDYWPIMEREMYELLHYAFNKGVTTGLKMMDSGDTFLAYDNFRDVMEHFYEYYGAEDSR